MRRPALDGRTIAMAAIVLAAPAIVMVFLAAMRPRFPGSHRGPGWMEMESMEKSSR